MTLAPSRVRSEPDSSRPYPPLFAGLPGVVWALCLLFVATMLFWSIAKPTYEGPDERQHVSAVLYWSEFRDWPGFKEMGVMLNSMRSSDYVRSTPREADAAMARPDRPSFADLTGTVAVSGKSMNQMSQHPPLYYALLGEVRHVLPVGIAADLDVWIMRSISILFMAPLPLLAAALARRLGATRPIVITAAAAVALTPAIAIFGGVVNSDNLLNAASAWALLGMGCVLTGDLRARTAIWIGAALAVALLTKAFAIPVALGVALAYLVAAIRYRAVRTGLASLAIVIGVAALGGWWWLRNLLRYGTLQPAGHRDALPDGPLSVAEALPIYGDRFIRVFFSRFWAAMDARGFTDPAFLVPLAASIVVFIILLVGPVIGRRSLQPERRVDLVVLITPFLLAAAILFSSTYRLTMETGYPSGVQGRYLFGAILGAIVVGAFALAALLPECLHPIAMIVVILAGLAATVWRMLAGLIEEWAPGAPGLRPHVEALLAWSPLPYAASISVLVLFALAAMLAVAEAVREYVLLRRSDSLLPVGSGA